MSILTSIDKMFTARDLRPFGLAYLEDSPVLMTGLACGQGEPLRESACDPQGTIGAFAQKHYYRELADRLLEVARELAGLQSQHWRSVRVVCNSRLPEKALAVAAGLGRPGRHSLVILPRGGSWYVLGGLILPRGQRTDSLLAGLPGGKVDHGGRIIGLADGGKAELAEACTGCSACRDACPVGAIRADGGCDPAVCLQAWAGRAELLPPALVSNWGDLMYGCDLCQRACPRNQPSPPAACTSHGLIGPGLSLRWVLASTGNELAARLKKTALGFSWIEPLALKRNALLAAASRGLPGFRTEAEAQSRHDSPALRQAARLYLDSPFSGN